MSEAIQNSSERKSAFGKFLFFFILSTLFIVGAVYFNVNISGKENSALNDEVARYRSYKRTQQKFVGISNEVQRLIDSLSVPGANTAYLNAQINDKIEQLANIQYIDSSVFKQLNATLVTALSGYAHVNYKYVSEGDAPEQLEIYKQKYQDALSKLETAQQNIDVLRNANGGDTQ